MHAASGADALQKSLQMLHFRFGFTREFLDYIAAHDQAAVNDALAKFDSEYYAKLLRRLVLGIFNWFTGKSPRGISY